MVEIDKYFNLEEVSNDSDRRDHGKFEDDLAQIAEDERLCALAPDLPVIERERGEKEEKNFVVIAGEMMQSFYQRHRVDMTLMT